MLSPLQRAAFIDSKIVSMVSSACFCVSWRFATRMAIRSLFSMHALREVRRSKTFDGWERYMTGPGAGKRRNAGKSGRLVRTLTHPKRARRRRRDALERRCLEEPQERFERFAQGRSRGSVRTRQRSLDGEADLILDPLGGEPQGGAAGSAHFRQRDARRIARQQPSALDRKSVV